MRPQLLRMSQQELDALFTASDAGPIPEGEAERHGYHRARNRLQPGDCRIHQRVRLERQSLRPDHGQLKNRIGPFGTDAIIADVYKAPSWLDGKECIVLDYSKTSIVAHWIRDEIRLIQPPGLYLGGLLEQGTPDRLLLLF